MKIDENLELLARAIRGEIKIEIGVINYPENGWLSLKWLEVKWDSITKSFIDGEVQFLISGLVSDSYTIREVKKLPLLTSDECEFLKWFPQGYWIARDGNGYIYVYSKKPNKDEEEWCDHEWNSHKRIDDYITLKFDGIQWSDEDCYTIGELIEYAKENK